MVTFLITSVLVLVVIAIAIYFWQKPAHKAETAELPPPPVASLFADQQLTQLNEAPAPHVIEERPLREPQPEIQEHEEREAKRATAREFIETWKSSPDRAATARMLHLAADADDAEIYNNAAELALNAWLHGTLSGLLAADLYSLLNSEYWLLSSRTRSSGAGLIMKRTLSRAKRELESVNNPN
jgi:hypothetical protein